MADSVTLNEYKLESVRYALRAEFDPRFFNRAPEVEFFQTGKRIAIQLHYDIYRSETKLNEITRPREHVPATWFDHFKVAYSKRWWMRLLRRFNLVKPIRYREIPEQRFEVETALLFPEIPYEGPLVRVPHVVSVMEK